MKRRSDPAGSPNREPQKKKKWVEPVTALLMALATLSAAWLFVLVSGMDAGRCAGFRPESFSLLSAGCLATVSN